MGWENEPNSKSVKGKAYTRSTPKSGEMAQEVKVLAAKSYYLNLILGTHIVGRENQVPQVVSQFLLMYHTERVINTCSKDVFMSKQKVKKNGNEKIQRINEIECWFFEEINNIGKTTKPN